MKQITEQNNKLKLNLFENVYHVFVSSFLLCQWNLRVDFFKRCFVSCLKRAVIGACVRVGAFH